MTKDPACFDNPREHDNRNYDYSQAPCQWRAEYPIILDWVKADTKVIDFGCGNGSLLELLRDRKNATGIGFDLARSGIEACRQKGIEAVCRAVDQPHEDLRDGQFDYSICNVTMQMVMYPEILFQEMIRVARCQIISFPNFAYYRNRLDLLLHGRMPRPLLYGYTWYSTGHIHQLSIEDFLAMVRETGRVRVVKNRPVEAGRWWRSCLKLRFPNLLQQIAVFMTERTDAG